ncbi:MAG: MerR family transcriptional regulator [Acidimicrobiia bacterium]|jgi:DNA-binding transcriptional MerR regulator
MPYTISEVARFAGVTVRTLHHYDRIGLLRPAGRSDAGYRLYDDADCARLQQILCYRELGFGLEQIRRAMDAPDFDRGAALRHQRDLLATRRAHLTAMIGAVDDAIAAQERGVIMTGESMLEVFGDFDPAAYEDEARERWSGPEYDESRRRTATYDAARWREIKAEADGIARRLAECLVAGDDPRSSKVADLAEEHRLHIDRWYYPCSHQIHAGLGEMYAADPRFAEYWDAFAPGLARFVRDAIAANTARAGGGADEG